MELQDLLNKYKIKIDVDLILSMWNESHRHFHNLDHLNDLIEQINLDLKKKDINHKEYEKLMIVAMFHDIIYDPKKQDNEEKSAEFFLNVCQDKSNSDIKDINNAILDTKTHSSSTKLSELFNLFDMNIVERSYEELLNWENGIYQEYKSYGDEFYKKGRLDFLNSLLDKYPNNTNNLLELINYVKKHY